MCYCRSQSLRTPANMFIINLAITDFMMCVTQTPTFFITSMHRRWIFGEKGNPAVGSVCLIPSFSLIVHFQAIKNGNKACNISTGLEALCKVCLSIIYKCYLLFLVLIFLYIYSMTAISMYSWGECIKSMYQTNPEGKYLFDND